MSITLKNGIVLSDEVLEEIKELQKQSKNKN